MTPSPESLRALYAELNDAALLEMAAERNALTPEAQTRLTEALSQRRLKLPDVCALHETHTPR